MQKSKNKKRPLKKSRRYSAGISVFLFLLVFLVKDDDLKLAYASLAAS